MASANAVPEPSPSAAVEPARRPLKKAFISYARPDRRFALRLARDLRAEGVEVWIDQTGIQGGDAWRAKIEKALRADADFLLIVSPAAKRSKYVRKELAFADDEGMPIVPVLHRRCGPWLEIGDLHYIDFTEWYAEGFAKLLQSAVPRRTAWRKLLIFLNRLRVILPILAILLAIAAAAYYLAPSETSFTISHGDASGIIVVRARNDGGRSSTLVGSSFLLDFGELPIESRKLVLLDAENVSRIEGHSDRTIRLTTMRRLTPKKRNETSYSSLERVVPLIPGKEITLWAQVEESGGRLRRRRADSHAQRIEMFIRRTYPHVRDTIY